MKGKKILFSEAAYILGLVILALGTAFMERANFGVSMVVAPAYVVYLKVSQYLSWFTFGMAEYCLQAVLLLITCLALRRVKLTYLFSFGTAVLYGVILDLVMALIALLPFDGTVWRFIFYFTGMLLCSLGVALLFRTYISPEAYELLVKEISTTFKKNIHKTKTVYDCISCLTAVVMSFLFFGFGVFEGAKLGTIFCALVNGWIISRCSHMLEHIFEVKDALKIRKWFE